MQAGIGGREDARQRPAGARAGDETEQGAEGEHHVGGEKQDVGQSATDTSHTHGNGLAHDTGIASAMSYGYPG